MTIDTSKISFSKTTAQGFLQLAIVAITAYYALPVGAKPVVVILSIVKAVLAVYQKDAGETPAKLPGSNATELVPSHEIPNDPAAKPVVTK